MAEVDDLPDGEADLVFVCTPASTNPDLLRACAKKGITAAFIASAGYGEMQTDEGRQAEAELVAAGRRARHPARRVPMGRASCHPRPSCAPRSWRRSRPAGTSASPASPATSFSSFENYAQLNGVGVSRAVSAGNAAAVTVPDYLDYYADDPETHVALAYVESVGDGRAFVDRLRRIAERLPIVLVKGGASAGGQRAAASHTGALASDDRVFDGACRQAGVSRADTDRAGLRDRRHLRHPAAAAAAIGWWS